MGVEIASEKGSLVSDERLLMALFQAAMVIILGNGESTLFWTDRWINDSSIEALASSLFRAVHARKKKVTGRGVT
jgi:hypothetical protein